MPSTPNFAIVYPAGVDNITPLQNWLAGIALGTDAALTTGLGGAPRVANSDAERASLFPSPSQGNLCVRPDKGWVEEYYGLYNSGTNPGGATPAGWYPIAGQLPLATASKTAAQTISPEATVSWSSTALYGGITVASNVFTVPITGRYRVDCNLRFGGTASASDRVLKICRNGTAAGTEFLSEIRAQAVFSQAAAMSGAVALQAGDTIQVRAFGPTDIHNSSGSGTNTYPVFTLEYQGPTR